MHSHAISINPQKLWCKTRQGLAQFFKILPNMPKSPDEENAKENWGFCLKKLLQFTLLRNKSRLQSFTNYSPVYFLPSSTWIAVELNSLKKQLLLLLIPYFVEDEFRPSNTCAIFPEAIILSTTSIESLVFR